MKNWRTWEPASEMDWRLAVERESIIRALAEAARLTQEQVKDAMTRLNLSRSVLYKLVQRYKQRPRTSSLLPFKRGRGRDVQLLHQQQEDLLQECIRQFYLTPERPSLAALVREVKRRFCECQLPTPAYETVKRRVLSLDLKLVLSKREGAKKAREKLGPVLVSTLRADLPLEVVQIDHTQADVIIVDQEHRKPIGRPWLSLAIDVATRAVVGFSISL